MTNLTLTTKNAPGIVAKLAAGRLADKAEFAKTVDKEDASVFGKEFESAQPGDTIYVKRPPILIPGSSLDITSTKQDVIEGKVPLTLDKISTIGIEMSSLEIAYNKGIKAWNEQVLEPAMDAIAADIDTWLLNKAIAATSNLVGTAGVTPSAILTFLQANQKLTENLAPQDGKRFVFINPTVNTATSDARKGLFNQDSEISKIYREGYVGKGQGLTYVESNLLPTYTNGNDVTGAAIDGAVATASSTIHIDGITTGTGTVAAGSIFTIAGVYDVHPLTKAVLPTLKQFVVVTGGTASGVSDIDIVISPTIYGPTSGSLQNVSALPADDAAIVFFGAASTAYQQNLALHKSAMRLCTVPLHLPKNQEFAARETVDGISVAVVRGFDINTRKEIMRFDVLAGAVPVRPEWMARITG